MRGKLRSRRRVTALRLLAVPAAAAVLLAALPAVAGADVFGTIQLASQGELAIPGAAAAPGQQVLYAHDSVISADGRYLAFDGYIGGYAGVWRRDLASREISPVAVGRVVPGGEACEAGQPTCDAALPSISADGRYVSFTTAARLNPGRDKNEAGHPGVYVRDMEKAASVAEMEAPAESPCESSEDPRACAFTLVSASSGSSEGLLYPGASFDQGAVASARSAMSADGGKVAFVTTAISDLAGPGTPADQVAVRDLNTRETQLVSVEYDPATGLPKVPATPVSATQGSSVFGGVDLIAGGTFPARHAFGLQSLAGASISADGSTVAWLGQSVFKQAPMLARETEAVYAEPLWRRIADGPAAPTRRVTGGSEPQNPACIASGEQELAALPGEAALADPCQGPFLREGAIPTLLLASAIQSVPQLSADGYTVAFLSTASPVTLGQNYGLGGDEQAADLYLADMRGGESRRAALRPLTQINSAKWAGHAEITDFAVSPDGRQVAFTTQRIAFPLGSPAYVSQPLATPEMAELFDVDLANDTLTRVTQGPAGEASERPHKEAVGEGQEGPYPIATDGALSPSFSADGGKLAFSSTAANLVTGDGNTPAAGAEQGLADGSDAFVVEREAFAPAPVAGAVSAAPPGPSVGPAWRISVTYGVLRDGRVILYVRIPGAGRLSAVAQARVSVRRSRSGRRSRVVGLRRRVSSASAAAAPNGEGIAQLTLRLASAYRSLAAGTRGLPATVTVSFSAPGQPALAERMSVSFVYHPPRVRGRRSTVRGRR